MEVGATFVLGSNRVSFFFKERPQMPRTNKIKSRKRGTSLVAQWLRIHLPTQGTRVQALLWEDPTCRGATKPVSHNY